MLRIVMLTLAAAALGLPAAEASFLDDFNNPGLVAYTDSNSYGSGGSYAISGGKLNITAGADNTFSVMTSDSVGFDVGETLSLDVPAVSGTEGVFMMCSTSAYQPDGTSTFGFRFRRSQGIVRIDLYPGGAGTNYSDPCSIRPARLIVSRTSDTGFDYSIKIEGAQYHLGSFTLTNLAGNYNLHVGAQAYKQTSGTTFPFDNLSIQVQPAGLIHNITRDIWYDSIQLAINVANNGDQIEVAPGTYNEAIDFKGKAVRLYSSGGAAATTINGTGHHHVVQCVSGEGANTILEGFTITGGNANGSTNLDKCGGGMYNYYSSPAVIKCRFVSNAALLHGGGMHNEHATPTVTDCSFSGNTAGAHGGGLMDNYGPTYSNIINCVFTQNTAGSGGGGYCNSGGHSKIINCTFSGNSASYGNGIYNYSSSTDVNNSIFWGEINEIVNNTGTLTVSYSDIQGGFTGTGNINADPCFVDAVSGNLRLKFASLCIDAGNNAVVPEGITKDMDGRSRFMDVPAVADTGSGTVPIVDMGAYEYPGCVSIWENILENPGFEDGTTGWTARWGDSIEVNELNPHSGTYCGRAYNRAYWWEGIQQSILGKMIAGETYQITGWVRTSSSASYNVTVTVQKTDDGGTSYTNVGSVSANSSDWFQLPDNNYTLTVNGTLTELIVYFEGPDPGVDIYVDDVNVYGPMLVCIPEPNASADVNFSEVYQELEGFGAAGAWYEGWLLAHPQKDTLYDILFRDLGLDIYRVRNCYGFDGGYIDDTKQVVQEARTRNPSLKILNSAWTPPAYLKSNNDTNSVPSPGTLKKDANDPNNNAPYYYVYNAYANWWADSIAAFESNGIHTDYMSIQNEPDWETDYESCKFLPDEDANYAGYNQAFEAVYQKLNSVMGPNMPKMLAPETTGFGGAEAYINSLIDTDHVYGYAHHLYSDGDYDSPDSFIPGMQNFGSLYGYKPLFQTEYEKLSGITNDFTTAMNLALHIHNSLVYEGVCSYFHWSLFWGGGGGLVTLPSWGSPDYTINPVYYAFKHYSKFTDPGWHRVAADTDSFAIRISAYKSPDDSNMAIVIINTSEDIDINLMLSLGSVTPDSSEIYRSVSGSYWSYVGTLNLSEPLLVPKMSITTIHLIKYNTCTQAIAGGHRLRSDINTDCYVDINDLDEFVVRWLRYDCDENNNYCSLADIDLSGDVDFIDLSRFASQWLTCNDPQNLECLSNW
jgi:glucuronoarabinoxylan endo-1,4-beta-xylanase